MLNYVVVVGCYVGVFVFNINIGVFTIHRTICMQMIFLQIIFRWTRMETEPFHSPSILPFLRSMALRLISPRLTGKPGNLISNAINLNLSLWQCRQNKQMRKTLQTLTQNELFSVMKMAGEDGTLTKENFTKILRSSDMFLKAFDKNKDGIVTEVDVRCCTLKDFKTRLKDFKRKMLSRIVCQN